MTLPRRYQIALVGIGAGLGDPVTALAKRLNALQEREHLLAEIHYIPWPTTLERDAALDCQREFSQEKTYDSLIGVVRNSEIKWVIGITDVDLGRSPLFFNGRDERTGAYGKRAAIISRRDWNTYAPPTRGEEQFLAYLVLCESICLIANYSEHQTVRYCLFDKCSERADLKPALAHPFVCEEDKAHLGTAHSELLPIIDCVLSFVKRRPFVRALGATLAFSPWGRALLSLTASLLGGLIAFSANWLAQSIGPGLGAVVLVVIILVVIIVILVLTFLEVKRET